MSEFFSVMFRAITGVKFTPETIIVLAFTFALGWLFGKLTRRIGILKGIALAIFGTVAYTVFAYSPGVLGFAFLMGVLANHGPLLWRIIAWAQGLGDIVYALKYRRAFENIRAEEARMAEERERQERADAYARAQSGGDSDAQNRWRRESQEQRQRDDAGEKEKDSAQRRSQGTKGKADRSSSSTGRKAGQQQRKQKASSPPPTSSYHNRHLETLGLTPGRDYTLEEIKRAYRKRAKETHPDAGGNAQDFMAVRAAWAALSKR